MNTDVTLYGVSIKHSGVWPSSQLTVTTVHRGYLIRGRFVCAGGGKRSLRARLRRLLPMRSKMVRRG